MHTQRLEKPGFLNFSGIWRKGRIPSIHPQDRNQAIINLETTYTEIHHTLSHLQFIISCWLIHTWTVKNDCIIQSILCLIHYVEKKILSGENFPSTSIYIKHSKKGWNWKTMTWNRQRLWKHGHDRSHRFYSASSRVWPLRGRGNQKAKRYRNKHCEMQQTLFALLQHFSSSWPCGEDKKRRKPKVVWTGLFLLTSLLVNLIPVRFVALDLAFMSFISTRLFLVGWPRCQSASFVDF